MQDAFDRWLPLLIARHTQHLSTSEFLKAVRALSARYVERRDELGRRSAIDSAGKRAAFAGFFAPLHFLIVRAIVRALDAAVPPVQRIVDFGCGTGVGAAAWALEHAAAPAIAGVDRDVWALDEARWNWQQLDLHGQTTRGDLSRADAGAHRTGRRSAPHADAWLFAWSLNELDAPTRDRLRSSILAAAAAGTAVLAIEPLSRRAAPWWPAWSDAIVEAGGRSDEWKFPLDLPAALDEISRAAGFRRESLGARSLWLPRR